MLLPAASAISATGVAAAVLSALNADSLSALGVFLGGLAALVSAVVALVALLRRKDPAEMFAEGVKYGQHHHDGNGSEQVTDRRRR